MTNYSIAVCILMTIVAGPTLRAQSPEDAAQAAAESWVKLVDAGNYGSSWEEAASGFKAAVTQARWTEAVAGARAPFGAVTARKVATRQATDQLLGAPAGKYVMLQFTTAFEKGAATEIVALTLDDERGWRVAGYFVRPA